MTRAIRRINQTDFDELDGTKERIESLKVPWLAVSAWLCRGEPESQGV